MITIMKAVKKSKEIRQEKYNNVDFMKEIKDIKLQRN